MKAEFLLQKLAELRTKQKQYKDELHDELVAFAQGFQEYLGLHESISVYTCVNGDLLHPFDIPVGKDGIARFELHLHVGPVDARESAVVLFDCAMTITRHGPVFVLLGTVHPDYIKPDFDKAYEVMYCKAVEVLSDGTA